MSKISHLEPQETRMAKNTVVIGKIRKCNGPEITMYYVTSLLDCASSLHRFNVQGLKQKIEAGYRDSASLTGLLL